jgi:acetyltransferase-like isoleucine patch superfamily enzyme
VTPGDLATAGRPRGWVARARAKGPRNLLRILVQVAWARASSAARVGWLRASGVRVGRGVGVWGPIRVHGDPRRVTIADGCSLHRGVTLWTHDYGSGHGRIVLGARATLLANVTINSYASVEIGDDAALGDGCYVQDNDHGTEPGTPIMRQPSWGVPIRIGRDVWLGARCIVLKGVAIGDGSVVGAGSVVARSLPEGIVAVGVPARPVKRRGEPFRSPDRRAA